MEVGRPRSGLIFDLFKKDKYAYKFAIRNAKCSTETSITNDLHEVLCSKDSNSFWKIWHSKFDKKASDKPKIIGGLTDQQAIADGFGNFFYDTCKPNSNVVNESSCKNFNDAFIHYLGDQLDVDSFFSIELICIVICELKFGKASGADGVTSEHIVHCHPAATQLMVIY